MWTSTVSTSRLALSRRAFIGAGAAGLATLALKPAYASLPDAPRGLSFINLHTGEKFHTEYWCDGCYQPDALAGIARVLRDHRNNSEHPIDTKLLETLNQLHARLEVKAPFHVISGYRSPESNAKMAAASHGVAKQSLHMQGMAIDIRVPGVDLKTLQKTAKAMGAGGVGYYAESNFVHVDVGRVRYW